MEIPRSHRVDITKYNESRKTNKIFNSIGSSASNMNFFPDEQYQKIHNYMELTNQGSYLLSNDNFSDAINTYQNALEISNQLGDKLKINESKCNVGIANFYLGKLNNAIDYIQQCYDYIFPICSTQIGNNNIQNLYLLCKSGANLCMCQLTMNSENNNCTNLINNIINIISKEEDLYKQLFCAKYLNNILFKVKTLLTNKNNIFNKYYENNINNSNEDEYNKINQLFIEAFVSFVLTLKFEPWLNSLKILYQKFEQLNDNRGIFFILFNQQLGICLKNLKNNNNILGGEDEEVHEAKKKLKSLLQAIREDNIEREKNISNSLDENMENNNQENQIINDDYIDNIIEDYNSKLFIIKKIYQILFSFEEQLTNNIQDYESNKIQDNIYKQENVNPNLNNEILLKLLLEYAKKNFDKTIQDMNLKNNLITDINNTLDLINSGQIDISQIDISSFDPEITQSLSLTLNNIINYIKKQLLQKYFDNLKYFKPDNISEIPKTPNNISVSPTIKIKTKENDKKLTKFLEKMYYYIYKGEIITKINYRTTGLKKHFYQIDYKEDLFESFLADESSKKPKEVYDFDDILKIVVGIKTDNVIKKINNLNIKNKNEPFRFMSLILRKRTIDLYFPKKESAKSWFYGLYRYMQVSERSYKIGSCTSYILARIKCKMINQLEISRSDDASFSSIIKKYFKTFKEKK